MHPPCDLSDEDRRALLARARRAIFETLSSKSLPDLPGAVGRLADPAGAFVTLRCNGRLRGCIGRTDAANSLAETVAQCAITAALQDPRFGSLTIEEMAGLEIEISVISELRPASPEGIQRGLHGIVVNRGGSRGLLLPRVALERSWSTTQLLEAACRKAGLERGAWQDSENQVFTFTAEVFSDASLVPVGGNSQLKFKLRGT
jgi:AmmeMemoRadiSam system protein A